jgi:hypothetical protein
MQSYNLRDAYTFILFHDKDANQQKYNLLLHISFTSLLGSHLSGINHFT